MVEHLNGVPPDQPQPPPGQPGQAVAIPMCRVLYQQLPNGARVVRAVDVGGMIWGGVVKLSTGYDATLQSKENPYFAPLTLVTHWPYEWKNIGDGDLVAASKMPPEPRFPRR